VVVRLSALCTIALYPLTLYILYILYTSTLSPLTMFPEEPLPDWSNGNNADVA